MSEPISWQLEADFQAYRKMREHAAKSVIRLWVSPVEVVVPPSVKASPSKKGQTSVCLQVPNLGGAIVPHFDLSNHPNVTAPQCTPEYAAHNNAGTAEWNHRRALADEVRARAGTITESSNSAGAINQAIAEHDSYQARTQFWVCLPEGQYFVDAYNGWVNSFNAALAALSAVTDRLLANAEREYAEMKRLASEVQSRRVTFETSPSGGLGVPGIIAAHNSFALQESIVRGFEFGTWAVNQNKERVAAFLASVNASHVDEAQHSAVTELDRLRDEYVVRKIDVPQPSAFTQSKHSQRFTFQNLNTGDYSWAILQDSMLNAIDSIAADMSSANYQIQVNSVYRNPYRSEGRSQHQYGFAIDWQVFDFNSNGRVTKQDWELLKSITDRYHPTYTEPVDQSGVGHVHVDWRGQRSHLPHK